MEWEYNTATMGVVTVSSIKIAEHLINAQNLDDSLSISHLKLQKLLYYCQACHLAMEEEELFSEEILALPYGPFEQTVYDKYHTHGQAIIPPNNGYDGVIDGVKEESYSVISSVLEHYGHLSAIALMQRTHREDPWQDAFEKGVRTIISKETMRKYYKRFVTYSDSSEDPQSP